jgi:hypothetical protein
MSRLSTTKKYDGKKYYCLQSHLSYDAIASCFHKWQVTLKHWRCGGILCSRPVPLLIKDTKSSLFIPLFGVIRLPK